MIDKFTGKIKWVKQKFLQILFICCLIWVFKKCKEDKECYCSDRFVGNLHRWQHRSKCCLRLYPDAIINNNCNRSNDDHNPGNDELHSEWIRRDKPPSAYQPTPLLPCTSTIVWRISSIAYRSASISEPQNTRINRWKIHVRKIRNFTLGHLRVFFIFGAVGIKGSFSEDSSLSTRFTSRFSFKVHVLAVVFMALKKRLGWTSSTEESNSLWISSAVE